MNDEQWQTLVGKNKKASCQHSTRDMIHAIFHVQATAASGVLPQDRSNENRSATPSATDVTPTRFNQLGSGLSNVAARGEGSRPIPPVAPTLENERFYGAADLYGVSGRPSADNIQQDRIGYCFSLLMLEL